MQQDHEPDSSLDESCASGSVDTIQENRHETSGPAPTSRLRTDESGSAPEASSTVPQPQLKTKTTIQRGVRPSPKNTTMRGSLHAVIDSEDDEDEFEDLAGFVATEEQKIEYVRAAARRKAEATGSEVPLLLDPKKI